jgi:hypothetical protein
MVGSIIQLAIIVAALAGLWKTFEKMGKPGGAGIVPFYNLFIIVQVIGKPVWWIILALIPFVNIVVMVPLAERFGKSAGFGVGLALLGFIFFPILGFGDAKFAGEAPPAPVATT